MSKVDDHLDCLGYPATDRITGFSGVVSSVSFDLYGCIQAALSPPLDKDGKLVEGRWFDIQRLNVDRGFGKRVMELPTWAVRAADHVHGPAEKPAGGIR